MKNKWILIIGSLAIVGIIAAILVYVFVYNKPHTDYAKAEPDFQMQAADLYSEFKINAQTAGIKYNGKVIEFEGQLNSVEQTDSLMIAVFSFEEGMFGDEGIRCAIIPSHSSEIIAIPPGTQVKLKGVCSGYNETDVIIEHCSLVKL